jgi:hypothetical protein
MQKICMIVGVALLLPPGTQAIAQTAEPNTAPTFRSGTLDLSLGPSAGATDPGPELSVGSIGLDSRAGNGDHPTPEGDSYHFNIPSEQPFRKVPGFLVKFPIQP